MTITGGEGSGKATGLPPMAYLARFATGAIHLAPVPAGSTTRGAKAG